jgi:hypothetical protein
MPIMDLSNTGKGNITPAAPANKAVEPTSSSLGTAAGKGFTLTNTGTSILYVSLGAVPTQALHGFKLLPGWYYEDPYGFLGAINAISSVAGGTATLVLCS